MICDVDPGAVSRVVAAHPGVQVAASRAELLGRDLDVYAPVRARWRAGRRHRGGPAGQHRLRRGEQPAGSPRHREAARRPRGPVRPRLRGQRGRRDPGLRRAGRVQLRAGPGPGRADLRHDQADLRPRRHRGRAAGGRGRPAGRAADVRGGQAAGDLAGG